MQSSDGDSGSPGGSAPIPRLDGARHRFVNLPGLRVHVAEAGSGPTVLLLHGFPQHWWGWRKVLPALADHHHVIAPDLRGAGWTDAPPDGYTEQQLVADAVALLDALGLERVDVVGLDVGGILGFRLCLAHPERVRRFVVMGAPHPYPALSGRLLVRVLLNAWRLWPRFVVTVPVLGPRLVSRGRQRLVRHMLLGDAPDRAVWSAADVETYLSRLREPARARAAVALYRALAVTASNRAARGAYRGTRLVTPTLGLYGAVLVEDDRDATGHPRLLLGYERYADDLRMVHVPGTGYYLAEERPEVVAREMLEFLGDG
ncbi:alpha/beta hydrolase [Actinotalea sp. AC32]|nr:alpha/beta hydrolase [Actinotalea sp. AC32]